MDESIVGPITRNRHEESGSIKPMGGNGHWESRRWRTRSSRRRWYRFSTRSGKRTFWIFRTGSGRGADSRGPRWFRGALDGLYVGTTSKKVNYVVDLDIRSFFDKVGHDHLEKFVRHRIGDERMVRLILKWLKAGVMEDGQWFETKEGTPQGAVISPLLANLYLHHVLDLWVQAWRKKVAHGDVIVVRYADDAVRGFQHREDAEKFLADLRERVRKFGLELHPEKTRLIEFGRYAAERRGKRGEGKPETFNFLGFTHICGKNHKTGKFTVHRKTIGRRMAARRKELRAKRRQRIHASPTETGEGAA